MPIPVLCPSNMLDRILANIRADAAVQAAPAVATPNFDEVEPPTAPQHLGEDEVLTPLGNSAEEKIGRYFAVLAGFEEA